MSDFRFFAYVLYARGEFYVKAMQGGTAHHFPGGRFKLKMAHKSLQVGDMAGKDIKIFLQKVGKNKNFYLIFGI